MGVKYETKTCKIYEDCHNIRRLMPFLTIFFLIRYRFTFFPSFFCFRFLPHRVYWLLFLLIPQCEQRRMKSEKTISPTFTASPFSNIVLCTFSVLDSTHMVYRLQMCDRFYSGHSDFYYCVLFLFFLFIFYSTLSI